MKQNIASTSMFLVKSNKDAHILNYYFSYFLKQYHMDKHLMLLIKTNKNYQSLILLTCLHF